MLKSLAKTWLLLVLLSGLAVAETTYEEPKQTLDAYLKACQAGDFEAAESCYTASSRKLVQSQTSPEEKRDPQLLVQTYEMLKPLEFREEKVNEKRAILWPNDESVPPFMFRIQDPEEGWRIDYHFMSHYIQIKDDGWKWRDKRLFKIWKSRE